MFATMLRNYWTTVTGFLGGFFYYIATNGAVIPATKQEWLNLLVAAAMAGAGLTAKDARVGSKPQ